MSSKPLTIYDMFLTSDSLETNGFQLIFGQAEFTVARAGGKNKLFIEARDKYLKIFTRDDAENSALFMANVWASSVVKGWKNVHDENGKELKFTHENCVKVLIDLPDLFDDIRSQSRDFQQFKERAVKEAEKN
jgi:ADP-dependent phosphofructokinase/glucokinase